MFAEEHEKSGQMKQLTGGRPEMKEIQCYTHQAQIHKGVENS